ncbi:unnamed protein product [Oppiella nova]|uniref:Cytochrome P450 n=1 Tax=Oppiella nova TaxID=334625 RepID=A0A7R9QXN1_9ACAR|nr:unnamed protein product [Oppiella nova]CAG2178179.1 unnamed protein product [Oppiella nova]
MIDSENTDKDLDYNTHSDGGPDAESTDAPTKRPTSGEMTAEEMSAQGIMFFLAGFDTTAAALTHAIYYLSLHPECQQKLYDELKTCDEFTYETLGHLKYLNAVINETLRLAPSVIRVQRECLQDYKLGNTGITIPKGASVEIYPYAIHRDPEYWSNPNVFLPDRWFESTHHPYAYLPFGGGPRQCIGQRFAISVMRRRVFCHPLIVPLTKVLATYGTPVLWLSVPVTILGMGVVPTVRPTVGMLGLNHSHRGSDYTKH